MDIQLIEKQLEIAKKEKLQKDLDFVRKFISENYEGKYFHSLTETSAYRNTFLITKELIYFKKLKRVYFEDNSIHIVFETDGINFHTYSVNYNPNTDFLDYFKVSKTINPIYHSLIKGYNMTATIDADKVTIEFENGILRKFKEITKEEYKRQFNLFKEAEINYINTFLKKESLYDFTKIIEVCDILEQCKITKEEVLKIFAYKVKDSNLQHFNDVKLTSFILFPGDKQKYGYFYYNEIYGSSDYEPYCNGFDITHVKIYWKELLYPIRNKISSVLKCAEELENLKINQSDFLVSEHTYMTCDNKLDFIWLEEKYLNKINEVILKYKI